MSTEEIDTHEFQFQPSKANADITELIFNHLKDPITRVRFSAVCRSWRWTAQRSCRTTPQFPLLLLFTEFCTFFNLLDGITYFIHVPEARPYDCVGSSYGWLIIQIHGRYLEKRQENFLINPLSKAKIRLPLDVTLDYNSDNPPQLLPMRSIMRAILSSDPNSSNDCFVAAIDFVSRLYTCRLGDGSWTQHHYHEEEKSFLDSNILLYERYFYATGVIDNTIKLVKFDPYLKFKAEVFTVPVPPSKTRFFSNPFVHCGNIFLVIEDNKDRSSRFFLVYKLDSRRWDWVKVESLDDGMIFLLSKEPKYLSVKDFPGLNLNGNCIYVRGNKENKSKATMHAFCLEDGTWKTIQSLQVARLEGLRLWFTPNMRY